VQLLNSEIIGLVFETKNTPKSNPPRPIHNKLHFLVQKKHQLFELLASLHPLSPKGPQDLRRASVVGEFDSHSCRGCVENWV
jgi:hypothetical protein